MRPRVLSIAPYAIADPDAIALSQTPAGGGIQSLTLNGTLVTAGVATLDVPRQIAITSAADDSARTFVIRGAGPKGNEQIEAITGAAIGAAQTVQAFSTVTSIQVDDNTAGAVEAGTTTIVSTNWFPLDYLRDDIAITLNLLLNGATANVTVNFTTSRLGRQGDSPQPTVGHHVGSIFKLFYPTLNIADHDTIAAVAADTVGNIAFPVTAIRLTSNTVPTGGTIELGVVQSGKQS